ncbi:hypothetical protein Tco_0210829 [Tanacetum coccineum]
MDSRLVVPVFNQGDDIIACLNKAITFLIVVASSRFLSTKNQLTTSFNLRNQATIQDDKVIVQQVQGRQRQSYAGEGHMGRQCTQPKRPRNAAWFKEKDLETYDSDCDDVSNAKAVLMVNLSNYGSDVILEVPHFEPYHTDTDNQSVHAMQSFEQTPVVDFADNEIMSDSNIEKANQEKNNESLTDKLERYKERVKTFEQRLNLDLRTREKMIDSQMDDMIKEKLALK